MYVLLDLDEFHRVKNIYYYLTKKHYDMIQSLVQDRHVVDDQYIIDLIVSIPLKYQWYEYYNIEQLDYDDIFYWIDLIGLAVENLHGEQLGVVADLMDNGAHPILRIAVPVVGDQDKAAPELLIPFVDQFVKTVDQTAKKITVDWDLDY